MIDTSTLKSIETLTTLYGGYREKEVYKNAKSITPYYINTMREVYEVSTGGNGCNDSYLIDIKNKIIIG